ncbi:hypothetical protein F4X73_04825 [Candidatus Poribacteria bacterium]|nr:hypothetical protein [Candidatus Poribacteria bacterium]MYB63993.1 hypothetical protein [Candidatus Poribacteria bacterium]
MGTLSDKITLNLDGDAEISVNGYIAPIEYTQYNFYQEWDELANLKVAEKEKQYPTPVFHAFLPSEPVSVGDCWEIQDTVLELLSQLHPNPNLKMHINNGDSLGLWACLRAYNDSFADIVFRIHAEFRFEKGWFTPAQFAGNLIINRITENVLYFQMYVPQGTLNFDVNWDDVGTDIGYCPKMELNAGTEPSNVDYKESISQEDVERALILRFYNAMQINWVSLEEALKLAPLQQKPIHAVSIDGPLTDEAC